MELYLIKFREDGIIKEKDYSLDCIVGGKNHQPIIVITHNECIFSTNNSIRKTWTQVDETFLQSKDRRQGIISSEFLLSFYCLNLLFLSKEKRKEIYKQTGFEVTDVTKLFEYRKSSEGYWDRS